jgi:hypothetical protein
MTLLSKLTGADAAAVGTLAVANGAAKNDLSNLGSGALISAFNASGLPSTVTIDVHDPRFGAKGDAVGAGNGTITGGNTLSDTQYLFTAADVGKSLFLQQDALTRTITGLSGSAAVFSPGATNVAPCYWLCGTDDTAAFDAAFTYAKTAFAGIAGTSISNPAAFVRGPIPIGGVVQLRAGHGYIVGNSSASYSGGRQSAVVVPNRCGLQGATQGFFGSAIHLRPNSYGHVIANEGNSGSAFTDFMTIANLSVYCYGSDWSPNSLDGVNINVAANGYGKIDPFNRIRQVQVYNAAQNGFRFIGRGELIGQDLVASYCNNYGIYVDHASDTRFFNLTAGGNSKTGIRVNGGGPVHINGSKAFYNGATGGTDHKDSANYVLTSDNIYTGLTALHDAEAQESRGSSLIVESAMNDIVGFKAFDPGRVPLAGGTLPDVIAGIHLRGPMCLNNVFARATVRATLTNFGAAGQNWGNTGDAVHIDAFDGALGGPQFNDGDIHTSRTTTIPVFRGIEYTTGAVKGGTGTSNGKNTGLKVDNVACT